MCNVGICAPCSIMLRKSEIKHLVEYGGFNLSTFIEDEWMFARIKLENSHQNFKSFIFPHSSVSSCRPGFQHEVIQVKFGTLYSLNKLLRIHSVKLPYFFFPIWKIQAKLQSLFPSAIFGVNCLWNFNLAVIQQVLRSRLHNFFSKTNLWKNFYCN